MSVLRLTMSLLCLALPAAALESPSIETGRTLFHSPALGTTGKSCASCHPEGDGLEGTPRLADDEMVKIINRCIRAPLAGMPLDPASTEMESLLLYLRSLPAGR